MNKKDYEVVQRYLKEKGIRADSSKYRKNDTPRSFLLSVIDKNEHPLVKTELVDVHVGSGGTVPNSFLVQYEGGMFLVRKVGDGSYFVDGEEIDIPMDAAECFAISKSFRYVEPSTMVSALVRRTPRVSTLLLILVAFVMASPIYSNLFNGRLVFGESVSSLLVVSAIFILVFACEYFIREWVMAEVNEEIEHENNIAEDVFFEQVINSKSKDAVVHWKTATESMSVIWRSFGHIGLDMLTCLVIMAAFVFLLGSYSIFPIVVYFVFFFIQLKTKLKAYRKILLLNQLKDQKLTYLIGLESPKRFFKFLDIDRIRKKWMGMTEGISVFNQQIQNHEEHSAGVLKFFSSTSIVVVFIAAYFAIEEGALQQSSVIALMLLNGRCSGALSSLSSRLYQTVIAYSKVKGSVSLLHEDLYTLQREVGVAFQKGDINHLVVKGVEISYDDKTVLKNMNLELKGGMSLAVMGAIGTGKSSLLRVLSGLEQPSSGTVELNNVSPYDYDKGFFGSNVAYYSPDDAFVGDSLAFNAALKYGVDQRVFTGALKYFGAGFVVNNNSLHADSVRELNLSSGQMQLVKMVCSLGQNPDLIILDEPCSNLSPAEAQRFMQKLRSRFPKAIVVFSTHSAMLSKKADFILDIEQGKIAVNKG